MVELKTREAVKIINDLLTAIVLTLRHQDEHLDDTQSRLLLEPMGTYISDALMYLDEAWQSGYSVVLAHSDWIEKLKERNG